MELSKYLVHTDDDQLYCVLDNSDDSSDETSKIRGVSVLSMSNAQQYFEKQDICIENANGKSTAKKNNRYEEQRDHDDSFQTYRRTYSQIQDEENEIGNKFQNFTEDQNDNILKQIESILGNNTGLIDDSDSLTCNEQIDNSLNVSRSKKENLESIQNKYIWFAAYNQLVSEQTFAFLLKAATNDIIKNTTTIELKDYDVGYFKIPPNSEQMYLFPNPGSICLVKLYLITKQQFIIVSDKINQEYCENYNLFQSFKMDIFSKQTNTAIII